jgi:hypothetical protein
MGLFAAKMAVAATNVMKHICAIFFISFSLSSNCDLPCSVYYEVRAGLDETIAGFFVRAKIAMGAAEANLNAGLLFAGSSACYHFGIAAMLFRRVLKGGRE